MIVAGITANSRVTFRAVTVRSSLASVKRRSSCSVRTKARMTRMPARFSRRTPLMRSIFTCIERKSGTAVRTMTAMKAIISGTTMNMSVESVRSVRIAMMTPPIMVSGAMIITVSPSSTSICTCCTSLVLRVINDGAPKEPISASEKRSTRRNSEPRMSRPTDMAVREE